MSTETTTETFAEIGIPTNPFPGLRPFDFDESHLFFGRDGQSEQLIGKLSRTRFLAVVGTSGGGKSSLVRAGLLPSLLGGFMTGAGSGWRVAIMRPGNDPIGNLARALNARDVFGSDIEENVAIQTAMAEATLRRGSLGLVDTVNQSVMPEDENLLVVVDQFEEIFRFARVAESEAYGNEAAGFVKLVIEASRQQKIPIYVVLTMRSDYLGDCSQFWGLPEAINESQYLIPRLTRDQLREAITGPVAVGGGQITPRLVNRLLNDVGDSQDQLPVLQHLLMRVWDESKEKRLTVDVKTGDQTITRPHNEVHEGAALDLCCSEAVGGMTQALSRHADEAFDELPDERHKAVAEKLFKALTEKGADNREIRRPITLAQICAITGASQSEAVAVINTFRQTGRSFLMPPENVVLNSESLIDISHESLIRGWQRLKKWTDEEAQSARIYSRLAQTAMLHKQGEEALLKDPALNVALDWREKSHPNAAWARRYHPEFETAMSYLDGSVAARDAEARDQEQRLRREVSYKRTKVLAVVLGLSVLLSLGSTVFAFKKRAEAFRQSSYAESQRILAENSSREARTQQRLAESERQNALMEKARANEEAENAIAARKTAEKSSDEAKVLRKKAEAEKKNADQQRAIAIRLQNQAAMEAHEALTVNSLNREINDDLANKNVEGVITKATQQLDYYKRRNDLRGMFENLTILGPAYLQKGEPTNARASATQALALLEKNPDTSDPRREHENHTVLSEAFLREAATKEGKAREVDLREALRSALLAKKVQEGSFGAMSPQLIPDLNNLSLISDSLQQGGADELRLRIIDIQKTTVQENNKQLVTYLNDLATYYSARNEYAKAEVRLSEKLAVQKSILPANDPQVVATLNALVALYRYEGKDAEANRLVKEIQGVQGESAVLQKGAYGPAVQKLQVQLQQHGFYLDGFPDGDFGPNTEKALIEFQKSQGMVADGVAGSRTLALLGEQGSRASLKFLDVQKQLEKLGFYSGSLDGMPGIRTQLALKAFQKSKGLVEDGTPNQATLEALGLKTPANATSITGKVTVEIVSKMFPAAPLDEIKINLPFVLKALEDEGLADRDTVLLALAFIRTSNGALRPASERPSRFNTSPDGHPFDLYDNKFGNQGPPDGEKFRGRGLLGITGRRVYERVSKEIGMEGQLVENPDLAIQPDIAARIFVSWLKQYEAGYREALQARDLKLVFRKLRGSTIGVETFTQTFQLGEALLK